MARELLTNATLNLGNLDKLNEMLKELYDSGPGGLDQSEVKRLYELNDNTNALTDALLQKLGALESSKYLGTYSNLADLQTLHPSPSIGSYAHVDSNTPDSPVQVYIWDNNDSKYREQIGGSSSDTAAQVKEKYESNEETNALNDANLATLNSISGYIKSLLVASNAEEARDALGVDVPVTADTPSDEITIQVSEQDLSAELNPGSVAANKMTPEVQLSLSAADSASPLGHGHSQSDIEGLVTLSLAVETNTAKRSYPAEDELKINHISVNAAADLDQMQIDIAAAAAGMSYKGDWDPTTGVFPGGNNAMLGWFYHVVADGIVDGQDFNAGDNLVATRDFASADTYAANWNKHDQTDAVQSVAGLTGSIPPEALRDALGVQENAAPDQDLSGLATKDNVLELDNTDPFVPTEDNHPATKKYIDDKALEAGAGDMLASVYDPQAVGADTFNVDNMVDSATKVMMTLNERQRLLGMEDNASAGGSDIAVSEDGVEKTPALASLDFVGASISETDNNIVVAIDKDHGSLTGTENDDHPQYHNDTRGDARYPDKDITEEHILSGDNPHLVTKDQVGLGNVPNIDATNASNITAGILPSDVLPPLAVVSIQTASSEAIMLALTTEAGDVVVRTDENQTYINNGGITSTLTDFTLLRTPGDAVLSVNGKTGSVQLNTDDLDDSNSTHKFISQAELDRLLAIKDGADVTGTANVTAAGAVMDSELIAESGIKSLSVPDNTIISAQGKNLVGANTPKEAQKTLELEGSYRFLADKPADQPIFILLMSQSLGTPLAALSPDPLVNNPRIFDFCTEGVDLDPPNKIRDPASFSFRQLNPNAPAYQDYTGNVPYTGHMRSDSNTGHGRGGPALGMADEYQTNTGRDVYILQVHWTGRGLIDNWDPMEPGSLAYEELYARMQEARAELSTFGIWFPDVVWFSPGWADYNVINGSPSQWAEKFARTKKLFESDQIGLTDPNIPWSCPDYPASAQYSNTDSFWDNYRWASAILGSQLTMFPTDKYDVIDGVHWVGEDQIAVGRSEAKARIAGASLSKDLPAGAIPQRATTNMVFYSGQATTTDSPAGLSLSWATNTAQDEIYFGRLQWDSKDYDTWTSKDSLLFHELTPGNKIRIEDVADPSIYVDYSIAEVPTYVGNLPAVSGVDDSYIKIAVLNKDPQGGWTDLVGRACKVRFLKWLGGLSFTDKVFFTAEKPGKMLFTEAPKFGTLADSTALSYITERSRMSRFPTRGAGLDNSGNLVPDGTRSCQFTAVTSDEVPLRVLDILGATLDIGARIGYNVSVRAVRRDAPTTSLFTMFQAGTMTYQDGIDSGQGNITPLVERKGVIETSAPDWMYATIIALWGNFLIEIRGEVGNTWDWVIDYTEWDLPI